MKISHATLTDATHLTHIYNRLLIADKLICGLKVAGIDYEGPAFSSRLATNAWLEVLMKDVSRIYPGVINADAAADEEVAVAPKRRKSSKDKPASSKTKKDTRKKR